MSAMQFLAKKSWHPKNLKNVQRVAKVEKQKRDEEKKMLELQKQIEEEREAMAYRKMQEANGGKVQSKRLDWMYDDPIAKQEMKNKMGGEDDFESTTSKAQGVPSDKEEIEQFLLGKKSISEFTSEQKTLKDLVPTMDGHGATSAGSSQKAVPGARFIQDKPVSEKNEAFRRKHEDPLFAIMTNKEAKRREILSNPIVMEKLRQEHAERDRKRKEAKILKRKMKKKKKEEKKKRKEKKRQKKEAKKLKKKRKHDVANKRLDTSSSDSSDDEGGHAGHVISADSSRIGNRASSKTTTSNSKYGLQKPSNSHMNTINSSSTGAGGASLGPTSYIIGKRKRYMEEKDQSNRNNSRFSRQSYTSKRSGNDEVNNFLRDIEKSGFQ